MVKSKFEGRITFSEHEGIWKATLFDEKLHEVDIVLNHPPQGEDVNQDTLIYYAYLIATPRGFDVRPDGDTNRCFDFFS